MTNEKQAQPLVSVVVPNYNYERYLEGRIESILNQTFQDFELILLDDASTDGSVAVMERYRNDPRVSLIEVNATNTGSPFKQWLKGLQLARGKYIWIAEADDSAKPEFLETCVRWAEKEDNVAVCYVGSILFDGEGREEGRDVNHWGRRARNEAACFDGKHFAARNLYWKDYIINASGVLFRREYALRLADLHFVNMRYCGDWLFWFEMAMQGKVVEVYRELNYFRQHATKVTATSRSTGGGLRESLDIIHWMEGRLPNLDTYRKRLRRGRMYRYILRAKVDEARREELFAEMKRILGGGKADYLLERRNQYLRLFLPRLATVKRDRL